MVRGKKLVVLASMVFGFAVSAQADVLYSQPLDLVGGGLPSDGVTGQYYEQLVGDNFTLSSNADVTGVTFWGSSENFFGPPDYSNMDSFVVKLYNDNAGLPGTEVFSGVFATAATSPVDTGSLNSVTDGIVYRQEISFAPIALPAGAYHVSVGADLVAAQDDAWAWENTGATFGDQISGRYNPDINGPWESLTGLGDMAFEINGTIPEPTTLGALAAIGVLALRRRG